MPRSYLVDLVETVHLFLKMLEFYCTKTGLVVQKKVRKKPTKSKKRKSTATKSRSAPAVIPPPVWEEIRPQLAAVFTSGVNEYPPPFDAASDTPIDEQRADCMKKIQKCMRDLKFEDAIGIFRAAREVWPEEGIFGVAGIPEDEELDMLETIYNADLGIPDEIERQPEIENENSESDDDEDEEEERTMAIVETDFDFKDFVCRFCHPRVVSACTYLLERYDKNLPHTNHCIVKMLHRIAWDSLRPAMMFQGTLFVVFQKILAERLPQYKELEKFAVFIIRKFTEVASKTPKAFIELLFWKNTKDAAEIQHGYDLYSDARDKLGKNSWTEEQEEELRKLYMENQTNPETNQDVIDWILDNLIDSRNRTRRGVIFKLKDLGLIFKAPTKKHNKDRIKEKVPVEFGEDEDEMLRGLWETYGDSLDPMSAIISRMPRKRPKHRFVDRLLELGIVHDKKQCRKKRQKKRGGNEDHGSDNSSNSDSSSSDSDHSPVRTTTKPDKTQKNKQNAKKKQQVAPMLSASEIAKLMIKAVDENLTEPLRWLAESLEEVALDQEAEGFDPEAEGVPLVPLTGDSIEAMTNQVFKGVLTAVGVKPPSDEQETYWRIPSSLHFETIRKRRELIIKAVNKELVIEEDAAPMETNNEEPNKDPESSNDDDLFNNLRKMRENVEQTSQKSRKRNHSKDDEGRKRKMQKIDEGDESSSDKNDSEKENLSKSNKRNVLSDSSDDDEQIKRNKVLYETFDSIRSSPTKKTQGNVEKNTDISIDSDSNDKLDRSKDHRPSPSKLNSDDENDISISKRPLNNSRDKSKKRKVFDDSSDDDDGKKNDVGDDDDDDILSFAKKTLEHDDVPDTEDILREIRRNISDDSEEEMNEIRSKKPEKRRRIIVDDDSD